MNHYICVKRKPPDDATCACAADFLTCAPNDGQHGMVKKRCGRPATNMVCSRFRGGPIRRGLSIPVCAKCFSMMFPTGSTLQ